MQKKLSACGIVLLNSLLLFLSQPVAGQDKYLKLEGPKLVLLGEEHTYTASFVDGAGLPTDPPAHDNISWLIFGYGDGVHNYQILYSTDFSVRILWQRTGRQTVSYEISGYSNYYAEYVEVYVNTAVPQTPNIQAYITQECSRTIITRAYVHDEANYDLYWQTSSDGTDTSLGSDSWFSRTTEGPIWLRARLKEAPYTWSEGSQYIGYITINSTPPPAPSSSSDGHVIGIGNVTLAVSPVSGVTDYRWYSQSTGGTPLRQNMTSALVTTNSYAWSIHETREFWVATRINDCESTSRKKVTAYSHPKPVISAANGGLIVEGNFLTLGVSNYSYDTYQWMKDNVDIPGATQPTYVTPQVATYKVRVTKFSAPAVTSDGRTLTTGTNTFNENYVISHDIQKQGVAPSTPVRDLPITDNIQSFQYADGLGRPIQTVIKRGSPQGKDIVQPVGYDQFGRETKKYLPYVADENNGWLKKDALFNPYVLPGTELEKYRSGEQYKFYQNTDAVAQDQYPYAESILEPSPLSRVIKQGAPGAAWQPNTTAYASATDATIKYAYESNASNEVLLWTYNVSINNPLPGLVNTGNGSTPAYYGALQLFKTATKDEHQNEVIEYKDKEGRVVLKKVQANGEWAQTYYIYDDYGNLVCVLPPEAVKRILKTPTSEYLNQTETIKESFLTRWAFRYVYDSRKRMIMKQVPGAAPVYMVYDNRDRLVLTQDGNQRAANKWTFTKYDALNRPIITGIYTHGSSISQSLMSEQISATPFYETYDGNIQPHHYTDAMFPQLSSSTDVLTVTYYDKYNTVSTWGADFSYRPAQVPSQIINGITYSQPLAPLQSVVGLVTATKVKVLGSNSWLRMVSYYDDKYRSIQSVSDHQRNGQDFTTNLYDFTGKILATKTEHIETGQPSQSVTRRFEYDHAGRLINTWHKVGSGQEVLLSKNEYNELGQLITKKLHKIGNNGTPVIADPAVGQPGVLYDHVITSNDYKSSHHTYVARDKVLLQNGFRVSVAQNNTFKGRLGYSQQDAANHNDALVSFAQQVDYRYNIRGWLTSINNPEAPQVDDLFNMSLRYNDPTANGGAPQYNGNISETIWSSAGLDKQSYGYRYDNLNRLTDAKYYNVTTSIENGRYDERIGAPSLSTPIPGYDLNGNIMKLFRNGKTTVNTYGLMDSLRYRYASGNQLAAVSDYIGTQLEENGFREATEGNLDYTYDANGNMTVDVNKGITSIEYNHLNLPSKVSKSATDYVVYIYDAAGRKLTQQVFGTTPGKTDYAGEMIFENDILQFINHEEGRVVMTGGIPEYQYHLKDHLGNVRLTFTTKEEQETATATLETANAAQERSHFAYYDEAVVVNHPLFDHTHDNGSGATNNATRLTGGNTNAKYGLARSLSVMPGDKISMEVYAKYLDPQSSNWQGAFRDFLIQYASSTPPAGAVVDGGLPGSIGNAVFPYASLLQRGNVSETAPKAYLNWLVFDRDFNPIIAESGYMQIGTSAKENGSNVPHQRLTRTNPLEVKEPGYVYIYLSNENETPVEVFFDDFKVEHIKGPVIEMEDYYPFGLTFNSYRRENSTPQRYLYQSKEWQDKLSLYNFEWRQYDPLSGRTTTADPNADKYAGLSPYSWVANNPLSIVDPDGRDIIEGFGSTTYTGEHIAGALMQLQMQDNMRNQVSSMRSDFSFSKNFSSWKNEQRKSDLDEKSQQGDDCCGGLSQYQYYIPVWGASASAGDAINAGNYIGAVGWFGVGLLEAFTFGLASELKIGTTAAVEGGTQVVAKGRAVVAITDETFSQALFKGAENVGGYSIYGTKGIVGSMFNRNIFLIETSNKSLSGFRSLIRAMESEAIGLGANGISIYGSSVINKGFLNSNIATRFGYTFERSGSGVLLQKALR